MNFSSGQLLETMQILKLIQKERVKLREDEKSTKGKI